MIIIQSQAEERLIENLEVIKEYPRNRRCLWLDLSNVIEPSHLLLQMMVSESCRIFQEQDHQLFILEKMGVMVIGNGITLEQSERFYHAAEVALNITLSSKNLTLYELGLQWNDVAFLAESFLEAKHLRYEQRKKKVEEQKRKSALDLTFSTEDLQAMSNKRDLRQYVKVMVVEDDVLSRKLVRSILEKHYSTTVEANGWGALTSYVATAPDIVFLDIGLPDISGNDLCAKLLEIDPKAHIVMLSGNGNKENIACAVEKGAKGFVVKPFSTQKLLQHIQKCLTYKKSA